MRFFYAFFFPFLGGPKIKNRAHALTRSHSNDYFYSMKLAWIQYNIDWKDSESNLSKVKRFVHDASQDYDLLVLPEMFDTGFVLDPESIKGRDQESVLDEMKNISSNGGFSVIFTMIWNESDQYTNRAFYISKGQIQFYDKVHLFAPGGEGENYKAGENRKVIETENGTKILPLVCYDLRFPEISRNTDDIDLIIYCASWPEARTSHWDILLKARAVENQCYVLGVNRIGEDGNNLNYIGPVSYTHLTLPTKRIV